MGETVYIIDTVRTNNFTDPLLFKKIGELWRKIGGAAYPVAIKYCIYHNYESDYRGDYDVSIAVDEPSAGETITLDGRYRVFTVDTGIRNPIAETWRMIWETPLDRAYSVDFEKYYPNGKAEIYVALN